MLKRISQCGFSLICSISLVLKFAEVTHNNLTDSSRLWLRFQQTQQCGIPHYLQED